MTPERLVELAEELIDGTHDWPADYLGSRVITAAFILIDVADKKINPLRYRKRRGPDRIPRRRGDHRAVTAPVCEGCGERLRGHRIGQCR